MNKYKQAGNSSYNPLLLLFENKSFASLSGSGSPTFIKGEFIT
jgi:hypothetical protein